MSRKYIKQIDSANFVYPNYTLEEYDIEIVHDINNSCVSGSITTFSATTISTSAISIAYDLTWVKNNAEPYISDAGNLNLWSVHVMAPGQDYFSPFRMVDFQYTGNTGATSVNISGTFTFTNTDLQIATLDNGIYNFEIRFIGHRCVLPVCYQLNLNVPTPTPTITATNTPTPSVTATNTPTPTVTPTNTPTPSPTDLCPQCNNWDYSNVPVGGDVIYYTRCSDLAPQTIVVGEGQTGSFCNCDSSGNPTTDNGTQLTQQGSCP